MSPPCIVILLAVMCPDYKIHFGHLFKSMECQSLDQFLERTLTMTIYVACNLRIDCPKQEQQEGRSSLLECACARGLG